ncbi:MAG: helix-turn-helix domain-containing protein [Candidatus Tectomicrobia bacterium]
MPGTRKPDKLKAKVIEAVRQGEVLPVVAEKLNVVPRTARHWVQQAREEAEATDRDPMLTSGSYRLAFLGQKIQQSQLEELVTMILDGEPTLKTYGLLTNIITNTSVDKVHRAKDGAAQVNVQFNFYE